jgi:hypothetical protein
MAITIVDRPEPLSERSFDLDPSSEPLVINSESARLLRQELERYCFGTITGRSFLIAGHRGSGKTTLVNSAFLETWKKRERGTDMLRPIYVPLHGPALFPDALIVDDEPGAAGVPGAGAGAAPPGGGGAAPPGGAVPPGGAAPPPAPGGAPPPAARSAGAPTAPVVGNPAVGDPVAPPAAGAAVAESEAERALKQITLALHRTVATEFTAQFHRAVRRVVPGRSAAKARELGEAAAALEREVYEMAPAARLREYWELAGVLDGGVLFDGPPPRVSARDAGGAAQGMRELVALSSVIDAYRRISGDARAQLGERDKQTLERSRTVTLSPDVKSLATAATTLVTGGLAAFAARLGGGSPTDALLGGLVGILVAGATLSWSSIRKRERQVLREEQFIFDLSVSTLDRVLPVLIQRLRAAGLAPVFVVDELDKVRDLNTRILKLVHHLKKLVAENAFFCFITDRGYYEDLEHEIATEAYGVQHSYFSQRVLVTFNISDFDEYLRKRLAAPPDPSAAAGGEGTDASAAPPPANVAPGTATADDYYDWLVLRWLMRYASRLHALDLHRELAKLRREDDGTVGLAPGIVRSARRYQVDLTLQVAIEITLDRPEVREWIADAPDSRQTLYDALYYIPRLQDQASETIDLESDAGKRRFAEYLERRTNSEWLRRESARERPPAGASEAERLAWERERPVRARTRQESLIEARLKSEDFAFYWTQLRALAQLLTDRGPLFESDNAAFWKVVDAWANAREKTPMGRVPSDVRLALRIGAEDSVLTGELSSLAWRYQRSGDLREEVEEEERADDGSRARGGAEVRGAGTRAATAGARAPAARAGDWRDDLAAIRDFEARLREVFA